MRLEEREHAAVGRVARGGQVGGDLGRMVRVRVDDDDTARLAATLEAAAGAGELSEHRRSLLGRHACERERGESRRGIPAVVLAGDCKLELGWLELPAAHGLGCAREEGIEELLDLGA